MKKVLLFMLGLSMLVLALSGVAQGWQGRMGGMGDPYGLISDDSDFLIHPAKIAKGDGVRFYGDYRFTYMGVLKWDYDREVYNLAGTLLETMATDLSGDEQSYNALLGAAFPLWLGRMGILFTYEGIRDAYDGDHVEGNPTPDSFHAVEMESALDAFALRLLYGLPVGGLNLGGEAYIAYRQEEDKTYDYSTDLSGAQLNSYSWFPRLFFIYPHESEYWEALFKGSLEGRMGPLDCEFTLRGGFIFSGANAWYRERQSPAGVLNDAWDMKGDVQGWRTGGDLWVRYPLADGLTLPFLVKVDYQAKTWDGDGPGLGTLAGNAYGYEHERRNLAITAGGGLDKAFGKATRVAGGIYYNYLLNRDDFFVHEDTGGGGWWTHDYTIPDWAEHQLLVRLTGEQTLSPAVALRGGLSFYYGWVNLKGGSLQYDDTGDWQTTTIGAGRGTHWGIGASLGGTVKFQRLTLEPFINAGYQQLDLEMDADVANSTSGIFQLLDAEGTRQEWSIGGGLSVFFDLP
jgi:hypothetical protein